MDSKTVDEACAAVERAVVYYPRRDFGERRRAVLLFGFGGRCPRQRQPEESDPLFENVVRLYEEDR